MLRALARRVGYRFNWTVGKKQYYWSDENLQHLCRSHLCELAMENINKRSLGATEPNDTISTDVQSPEDAFHTPTSLKEFAASMQHSEHRFTTPFAQDFMQAPYRAQISRRQLSHHLLVSEGHVDSLVQTSMLVPRSIWALQGPKYREPE